MAMLWAQFHCSARCQIMANDKKQEDRSAKLRREAEKKFAAQPPSSVDTDDDMKRLVHELQVHQIELEMQNEELCQTNLRLEEAKKRLENIFTNSQAGYFFIDTKGCYRKVNNAWLQMHGYNSPSEVLGKHFSITQTERDRHKADRSCRTSSANIQ